MSECCEDSQQQSVSGGKRPSGCYRGGWPSSLKLRAGKAADYCERERQLSERVAAAKQLVASLQALLQDINSRQQDCAGCLG
ncbi:TPA: hypothetical protein ACH3X3_006951 [Trebouxia sp. C0006]